MTFTTDTPTAPGFYAWKKTKDHLPLAAVVHMAPICGFDVEFSNGSEGHPERCGGEWCRLVPASELRSAFNEGDEFCTIDPAANEAAWATSRTKRVMEGKE